MRLDSSDDVDDDEDEKLESLISTKACLHNFRGFLFCTCIWLCMTRVQNNWGWACLRCDDTNLASVVDSDSTVTSNNFVSQLPSEQLNESITKIQNLIQIAKNSLSGENNNSWYQHGPGNQSDIEYTRSLGYSAVNNTQLITTSNKWIQDNAAARTPTSGQLSVTDYFNSQIQNKTFKNILTHEEVEIQLSQAYDNSLTTTPPPTLEQQLKLQKSQSLPTVVATKNSYAFSSYNNLKKAKPAIRHVVFISTKGSIKRNITLRDIAENNVLYVWREAMRMYPQIRFIDLSADPLLEAGPSNIPTVRSLFMVSQRRYPFALTYTYVNSDCLFDIIGFYRTLEALTTHFLKERKNFFAVGHRREIRWKPSWNWKTDRFDFLSPVESLDYSTTEQCNKWMQEQYRVKNATMLRKTKLTNFTAFGPPTSPTNMTATFNCGWQTGWLAQDFFITSRNVWHWRSLPRFVVGRLGYDNWLVDAAYHDPGVALVDVSRTLAVVHQNVDKGGSEGHQAQNKLYNINLGFKHPSRRYPRTNPFDHGSTLKAKYVTEFKSSSNNQQNYLLPHQGNNKQTANQVIQQQAQKSSGPQPQQQQRQQQAPAPQPSQNGPVNSAVQNRKQPSATPVSPVTHVNNINNNNRPGYSPSSHSQPGSSHNNINRRPGTTGPHHRHLSDSGNSDTTDLNVTVTGPGGGPSKTTVTKVSSSDTVTVTPAPNSKIKKPFTPPEITIRMLTPAEQKLAEKYQQVEYMRRQQFRPWGR